MLGLGRALGETMAVLMILAPGFTFSLHILEVGNHQSIAANIASRQAEPTAWACPCLLSPGRCRSVLTSSSTPFPRGFSSPGASKTGGPIAPTPLPSREQGG